MMSKFGGYYDGPRSTFDKFLDFLPDLVLLSLGIGIFLIVALASYDLMYNSEHKKFTGLITGVEKSDDLEGVYEIQFTSDNGLNLTYYCASEECASYFNSNFNTVVEIEGQVTGIFNYYYDITPTKTPWLR